MTKTRSFEDVSGTYAVASEMMREVHRNRESLFGYPWFRHYALHIRHAAAKRYRTDPQRFRSEAADDFDFMMLDDLETLWTSDEIKAEMADIEKKHQAEMKNAEKKHQAEMMNAEKKHQAEMKNAEKKHQTEMMNAEKRYKTEADRKEKQYQKNLEAKQAEIEAVYSSNSYKIGNALMRPLQVIRDLFPK